MHLYQRSIQSAELDRQTPRSAHYVPRTILTRAPKGTVAASYKMALCAAAEYRIVGQRIYVPFNFTRINHLLTEYCILYTNRNYMSISEFPSSA